MLAQKALVVTQESRVGRNRMGDALNALLRAGWTVTSASPMGGGGQSAGFASLVLLEQAASASADILEQIEEATAPEVLGADPAIQDPLLRRLQDDADDLGPLEN